MKTTLITPPVSTAWPAKGQRALDLWAQLKGQGKLDAAWVQRDPDLAWLHTEPRFWEIVGRGALA
jgi:hypothetical protein